MRNSVTAFSPRRKRNLLVAAYVTIALGGEMVGAQPTTFDFTNVAGGDL